MTHSFRFVLVLFGVASAALAAAPAGRPNILFILADDLGLDGLSCYGSDVRKTPNLDKLAASGTRFETCYAAPLCGPSRCLLMTGRYAFRTGGITNQSWRGGGPGAWGFSEYSTDPTAGGWYWQTTHQQNGQEISVPAGTYAPDVIQNFTLDFLRRHKDEPFSFMAIDRQSGR
jgi:arylsulfatase A